MQELVNQQMPFYESYKATFKNLRHAYIKIAHQNEKVNLKNMGLENHNATLVERVKKFEKQALDLNAQIFNLTHNCNQLEHDMVLVNKDRKKVLEQHREAVTEMQSMRSQRDSAMVQNNELKHILKSMRCFVQTQMDRSQ